MRSLVAFGCVAGVCMMGSLGVADDAAAPPAPRAAAELDKLVGQPVDIAPWAYVWRADVAVQEKPEACFIPRRLERLDKVYRTAYAALPPEELKSIHYTMPDLVSPLLPPPKGSLLTGLLWTAGAVDYQVELQWPSDGGPVPSPDEVEVRVYPTSYGWFGWTVDRILSSPAISPDGLTWTYKSDPTLQMDYCYNQRVPAATEMVAVFCEPVLTPDGLPEPGRLHAIPTVRILGPSTGTWKRMDVAIEWGFQPGSETAEFDGRLDASLAMFGPAAPFPEDETTTVTEGNRWQSAGAASRRGIIVPVLYAADGRAGLDGRMTAWTGTGGFTFRISDLEDNSILLPERGVFVTKADSGQTARQFTAELDAKDLRGIREMVAEHPEAASFQELMQEVRLWTCPEGTQLTPFAEVEDPPMQVELPDPGWTEAWRAASFQLRGKHMWGGLAFEVGRVAHEMDLIGLHTEADAVYDHFLESPGVKPDGDYSDGYGALEWAASMRHDMGYSHDGTHASTGRLLFAMAERYFLTGDADWFKRNRARLQAAADWIIRQRTRYLMDVPNRDALHAAGLMPPSMLGDYAIPSCDWHWYYVDNALALQGVQRFADALAEFEPEAGQWYRDQAEAFRKDLRRAVEQEAALAPVRLGRDGMYHTYIPRMAYAKGLPGPELGAPQFPECDRFMGALPLAEPFAALHASDDRMVDTLDMMEEMGTSAEAVQKNEDERRAKSLPTEDTWFWNCYVILPKASHNANIYLLQDDVPNFLRFWMNAYASVVGADGKLWEHWHLGNYDPCGAPDNGTAGWFMENFRNLLVMEDGQSLWVARATPRAWLEQGKKISVKNAPTYFGAIAYEIVSDVDNGKIRATVEMPSRPTPEAVLLRLRHPETAPGSGPRIKGVTVNGQPWTDFDPVKESVRLHDVQGAVKVEATY